MFRGVSCPPGFCSAEYQTPQILYKWSASPQPLQNAVHPGLEPGRILLRLALNTTDSNSAESPTLQEPLLLGSKPRRILFCWISNLSESSPAGPENSQIHVLLGLKPH